MDRSELKSARHALELLRQELQADLRVLRRANGAAGAGGVDGESVMQIERELARVDAAFQRLHTGRYGYCSGCGEEIELNRLRADPTTDLCTDCNRRIQRHIKRN